jgi:hypothetical protein
VAFFLAFTRPRLAAPGGALLHPVLLLALAALVFNDHVLKATHPGWLSGKLSDFAVVVLLPLFLHGGLELLCARLGRPLQSVSSRRVLIAMLLVSSLVFALPEVWEPAERCYRYGLGALRYPFRWLWARLSGHTPAPRLLPVRATADLTDLLALPMTYLAWRVGKPATTDAARSRAAAQTSAVSHST